jgi:hypothetical protein
MKKLHTLCLLSVALGATCAQGAIVNAPWSPDGGLGNGEQNLYQLLGMANAAQANSLQVTADQVWSMSIGNQFSTLLIEQAGNANYNAFGVYEIGNTANRLQIFPGAAGPGGASKYIQFDSILNTITVGSSSITVASGNFGFFLDRGNGLPLFFSQNMLNPNGADQMVTYNLLNTIYGTLNPGNTGWILAWEDLNYGSSDKDFNDFVVSLSALPVPEPTTIIAGALLILPFGASTLRFLGRRRVSSAS